MPFSNHDVGGFATQQQRNEDEEQIKFDLEFYAAVLERNGEHVDVLRRQVELLARTGNYEEAYKLDRRLVRLLPRDFIARYNLACSLSMLGNLTGALRALEEALQLGYSDFAHLEADSDLDAIKHHARYFELLKKYDILA